MHSAAPNRRLWFIAIVLTLAFVGLGCRLVQLQVFRHDVLRREAMVNTYSSSVFEPRRGDIRDIRGNILATSKPAKIICADPSLIGTNQWIVARTIAPLLEIPEAQVAKALSLYRTNELGEAKINKYVVLKRKVPVETWTQIQEAMKNLKLPAETNALTKLERQALRNLKDKAIFGDQDQLRVYPFERLASQVIGFVGRDPAGFDEGKEGIEFRFNSKLKGTPGWRVTERDRRNRELVSFREHDVPARDGMNVVLTLDAGLQHIVEQEMAKAWQKHKPESISVTVVRPRTGEILAMATMPNFDPNNPGKFSAEVRKNRIITDVAEPGSTFKVVVVSAALNEGLTTLNRTFNCENGYWIYKSKPLRDDHPYGVLSTENIIVKSSNIGAAKIGLELGDQKLYDYIRNFGFGQKTGISLIGESPGIFDHPKKWDKIMITRIPMGHSIAVTPLQMVMAMSALANEGKLMRPILVNRVEDDQGRVLFREEPQMVRQVIKPQAATSIIKALKSVVSTNGTAPKVRMDHYVVAGKTGTAQKIINGAYVHSAHYSSFIGFLPADKPEICMSVVLDNPRGGYYGGTVAGPVFKDIAERAAIYMGIPPDMIPEEEEEAMPGIRLKSIASTENKN